MRALSVEKALPLVYHIIRMRAVRIQRCMQYAAGCFPPSAAAARYTVQKSETGDPELHTERKESFL